MTAIAELENARADLLRRCQTDPFVKRFMAKATREGYVPGYGRAPPTSSVEDALGERVLTANLPLETVLPIFTSGSPDLLLAARVKWSALILEAEVFWWTNTVLKEVQQVSVPAHRISPDVLPYPCMWFTFETSRGKEGYDIDWLLLHDYGEGFAWLTIISGKKTGFIGGSCPYNSDYEPGPEGTMEASILALLAFLNSPYIEHSSQRATRAARREWSRKALEPTPLVHVVRLREPLLSHQAQGRESTNQYAGHWWVRGHIRSQWYPSLQAHNVIWIAPYIKGNLSGPLIEHAYAVVR